MASHIDPGTQHDPRSWPELRRRLAAEFEARTRADPDGILAGLGVSGDEVLRLRGAGVVGPSSGTGVVGLVSLPR